MRAARARLLLDDAVCRAARLERFAGEVSAVCMGGATDVVAAAAAAVVVLRRFRTGFACGGVFGLLRGLRAATPVVCNRLVRVDRLELLRVLVVVLLLRVVGPARRVDTADLAADLAASRAARLVRGEATGEASASSTLTKSSSSSSLLALLSPASQSLSLESSSSLLSSDSITFLPVRLAARAPVCALVFAAARRLAETAPEAAGGSSSWASDSSLSLLLLLPLPLSDSTSTTSCFFAALERVRAAAFDFGADADVQLLVLVVLVVVVLEEEEEEEGFAVVAALRVPLLFFAAVALGFAVEAAAAAAAVLALPDPRFVCMKTAKLTCASVCLCLCVCASVCLCVCASVCLCLCVCLRVGAEKAEKARVNSKPWLLKQKTKTPMVCQVRTHTLSCLDSDKVKSSNPHKTQRDSGSV